VRGTRQSGPREPRDAEPREPRDAEPRAPPDAETPDAEPRDALALCRFMAVMPLSCRPVSNEASILLDNHK
jgi:hypothetical protein